MDSAGVSQDEANIRMIVEHARELKKVHALFLVVNEQAPRFDEGMQAAVNLLKDSFGPQILANVAIVFTRADGRVNPQQSQAKANEFVAMIARRTGVPVTRMASYQIECHPESFEALGVPPIRIEALKAQATATLADMLRWAQSCTPIDTSDAVIGEYVERQRQRAAEQEAARQAAVANAARQEAARQAAAAAAARQEAARQEAAAAAAQQEAARQAAAAAAAQQEAAAANARAAAAQADNRTFLNFHGFKIGGKRIW